MKQLALDADELVDGLDHVDRDADRARLVGDGARDGLANPPRGVGGELEALRVVEFLDCANQAEVAFLNQVEEEHAATHIAFGNGDDETQVRLDELVFCVESNLLDTREAATLAARELAPFFFCLVDFFGCLQAGFNLHGQVDLFGRRQKVDFADFLEVHAHRIAREHGN